MGQEGWFNLTFYEFENHVTNVTQDLFFIITVLLCKVGIKPSPCKVWL